MRKYFYQVLCLLLLFGLATQPAEAQKKKKKKKGKEETTMPKPMNKKPPMKRSKGPKSIKDVTKACKKMEGLFTLYQDTTNGSLYLQISKDQIGEEFIYFSYIENSPLSAGAFRGSFRANTIFTIQEYYGKLEFVEENTDFYFDPDNALSKAADANISKATVLSEKIFAQDSAKENFLIKADGVFQSEKMTPIKFPSFSPRAFNLGRMNKGKTKYLDVRNYPENTDVVVEYAYENPMPRNYGDPGVTDARYVNIQMQHSFIKMPENDFEVRKDDPRVGFFLQYTSDMTSTSATPYRDFINKWHLVKKDPNAELSEPVEPITWWIENTTPVELREGIKQGVLGWNKSFEKAGFKNAMVVKIQPDDAEWDAGDIRYNVIRWTASPVPPFRGYGPSFTNPRTGQILGADIMLDYSAFKRVFLDTKPYEPASFLKLATSFGDSHEEEALEENGMAHKPHMDKHYCAMGLVAQNDFLFADAIMKFDGADEPTLKQMEEELLIRLVMHEVGHTLGLMHNMKSSFMLSPLELQNKEITGKYGVTGSVMDYPVVNIAKDRSKQGHYYSPICGPYDDWAIEWAYTPDLSEKELEAIAARSTEPKLIFGNDADDMRAPGKAIDPRVMVYDLSNDPVTYSSDRMDLVMEMMKGLKAKYKEDGETYQELRTAYGILFSQYYLAAGVTSRYIGGVYVDRAMQGQAGGTKPFTPVDADYQKKAMKLLSDKVFAPDAYNIPSDLLTHLQIQRRGFNLFGGTEDPKIHDQVLSMQANVLRHILHWNTLQRIVDSELYGNEYAVDAFMTDLNDAIFKADQYGNVNSFRQNLQLDYTKRLIDMIAGKRAARFPNPAKSMALYNLQQIRKIASNNRGDVQTKAHKAHLKLLIDKALEN